VIEMLLHSHDGEIAILPALPESWQKGSFRGLVARGNVVVDAWWENGQLTRARLTPRVDGDVVIAVESNGYVLRSKDGTIVEDTGGRISTLLGRGISYELIRRQAAIEC
jgi:hypothetical protein